MYLLIFEGFYHPSDDGVGRFFIGANSDTDFGVTITGKEYPFLQLIISGVDRDGADFIHLFAFGFACIEVAFELAERTPISGRTEKSRFSCSSNS